MASKFITEQKQRAKELSDRIETINKEIVETEKRRDELTREQEKIQAEINQRTGGFLSNPVPKGLYEKLDTVKHQISVLNGLEQNLYRELDLTKGELRQAESILDADRCLTMADETLGAIEEKLSKLRSELDTARINEEKLKSRLDNLNREIDSIRSANSTLLAENPDADIDLAKEAALQQEARAVAASLEKQNNRITRLKSQIDQATKEMNEGNKSKWKAKAEMDRARLKVEFDKLRPKVVFYAALCKKLDIYFKLEDLFKLNSNEVDQQMKQLDLQRD